jgi:hypothetical protein
MVLDLQIHIPEDLFALLYLKTNVPEFQHREFTPFV